MSDSGCFWLFVADWLFVTVFWVFSECYRVFLVLCYGDIFGYFWVTSECFWVFWGVFSGVCWCYLGVLGCFWVLLDVFCVFLGVLWVFWFFFGCFGVGVYLGVHGLIYVFWSSLLFSRCFRVFSGCFLVFFGGF